MNCILKFGLRFSATKLTKSTRSFAKPLFNNKFPVPASRTWHMCSKVNADFLKPKPISECCHCGCSGLIHTAGEKDLVEFLKEEIAEEKKTQKMKSLPADLQGFIISTDMAELRFEKKTPYETITVSMNVNHSVDTEGVTPDGSESEEMKSKPSFEVDIVRNKKTLSFSCTYTQFNEPGDFETADAFQIVEVTYFEGDWTENTYSAAADLLDENLYDLFMGILHEKGITKEFIEKASDIATSHEHSQYIGLLENVQRFASAN